MTEYLIGAGGIAVSLMGYLFYKQRKKSIAKSNSVKMGIVNKMPRMVNIIYGCSHDGNSQIEKTIRQEHLPFNSNGIPQEILIPDCVVWIKTEDSRTGQVLGGLLIPESARCQDHVISLLPGNVITLDY